MLLSPTSYLMSLTVAKCNAFSGWQGETGDTQTKESEPAFSRLVWCQAVSVEVLAGTKLPRSWEKDQLILHIRSPVHCEGRIKTHSHQITGVVHCSQHVSLKVGTAQGQTEDERTGKTEIRKTALLGVGRVCKAVFWPAPGFRKRTFDGTEFSADGTIISASITSHCKWDKESLYLKLQFWNQNDSSSSWAAVSPLNYMTMSKATRPCQCQLVKHSLTPCSKWHAWCAKTVSKATWASKATRQRPKSLKSH